MKYEAGFCSSVSHAFPHLYDFNSVISSSLTADSGEISNLLPLVLPTYHQLRMHDEVTAISSGLLKCKPRVTLI